MYSLDTNVIIRFLTRDNPELYAQAKVIMESVFERRLTVTLDPVVLAEVVWVLGSFYGMSREAITQIVTPIMVTDNVLIPSKQTYLLALHIFSTTKAHFADACACASAILNCDGNLLSFDRDLSRVPGIIRSETV